MNNIVQIQDSGITKYEYTVIMTSLIEIFITILVTTSMGIYNILVISLFSFIVLIINFVYWNKVKNRCGYLFEEDSQ